MTDLRAAIDHYHSLLDDEMAQASQAQLNDQLHRRELFFGERPLCTVLRPRFLTGDQYRLLSHALRSVMPAFESAYQAALASPAVRAQLKLTDWEEELVSFDPGFRDPSPTARMDSFFTADDSSLYLTEYNAETPAAAAYNDVLSEVFYGLPILREFEQTYEVTALPGRHHVLHALLDAYRQWGGRERPRICILDWREVPTHSEFVLFQQYFESQGYDCIIADPREFEYRNGTLLADGITHVTLIYKRVLLSELVQRGGLDHPVIRAVRDRAALLVNPFRCKLMHKKASLALLSDETNAALYTASQLQAIARYIPWTRVLSERHTQLHGGQVDLVPHLRDHKDEFVCKPNDEYGGKGVILGWTVTQAEWEETLAAGLREPSIVQERVPAPSEPYPSLVQGHVQVLDRMLDTNPYIWHGAYMSSCLTRLSTAALLNVTAGGGSTVPTFIIESR